ncbi:MAG: hypothetical protein HOV73_18450 [Streptomyces sp.]|nr:hypothetical protein [Streptomyces sp.]NUS25578.1 hypothetical protein [Streptomyces sp.]NUS76560.1 hypothetical protein [Streptomyces sp.]
MMWALIVFGLLVLVPAYAVDGWPRIYLAVLAFVAVTTASALSKLTDRRR